MPKQTKKDDLLSFVCVSLQNWLSWEFRVRRPMLMQCSFIELLKKLLGLSASTKILINNV